MKKRFGKRILVFVVLSLLSGCATYNLRVDSTREWIEGKAFPVLITITKPDKISDVVLHYSFNSTGGKSVHMNQEGNSFTYTIPEEEVVPGILRYTVSYSYKDKGKSTGAVSVKILTHAEARRKYIQELSARISFSPPARVPINRDARLLVQIKSPKTGTKVTFYYKTPEHATFQETELVNKNGDFVAVISRSELQAGHNTYYFRVTEDNADVGELEAFVGGRDDANPFQFTILSLAELKEAILEELHQSVSHEIPQNVYETRDVDITLSIDYRTSSFIREFSKGPVCVEIFYKSPTAGFKKGTMSGLKNQFTYRISAMDLKSGYDSYYFKITDNIEDIGAVTIEYPESGRLFSFHILTVEEIRRLKMTSLFQRISHEPVKTADGISDLNLALKVGDAGAHTTAVLFFKKPAGEQYKSVHMTKDGSLFEGVLSVNDQQEGYTQYYFMVTETDKDVGMISVEYPTNGSRIPFQYTVLDKNVVKAGLEADLMARITHRPVTTAAEGEDLKLTVNVKNSKSGTLVFFCHRKPGESSYRQTELPGNGPQFTMTVPKQDIRSGYSQYYFMVKEPHNYFGYIEATLPPHSEYYEFEIRKLKDAILDGIDFTPLSDAEYGTPVEAKIILNNSPEGTRVYLKYRRADDTLDYTSVEMKQKGTEYSAVLSPEVLGESTRVDYYISIVAGQDEFTYPDESIIPLYFYVKKQIVEDSGDDTVFGTTGRTDVNMLEGRVFQLEPGTDTLPQNMHKDYKSLIVLYARKLDIPSRNFTKGFPGLENVFEWFGIQYRGTMTIKESGLYAFRLLSDDGSKLYIDSILVIDNDGTHAPASKTGEIYLSPGTYPIRVDYFQGPRMHIALQLFVTPPGEEEKVFDLKDFE
jgi:hypothetical protein